MVLKLSVISLALFILGITGVYLQGSHLHTGFIEANDELRHYARCGTYPHNITYTRDDCNKTLIVNSCKGKCVSETVPQFYASRADIPSSTDKRYNTECKCCGLTHTQVVTFRNLDFLCKNGTTIYSDQILSTARGCACADCEQ